MKRTALYCLSLFLSGIAATAPALAAVTAEDAWVRATVPGQTVAAGYMKLRSSETAALVDVSTPAAAKSEIHEMSMQDGVMKMRRVTRVPLPADRTVEFKPGGYHLMLVNIPRPLKAGEKIPLTLVIEQADKKRVEVHVEADVRSTSGAKPTHEHHH